MKDPLGLSTMNQTILSITSLLEGNLEEVKISLAWRENGPKVMLHLERVAKGFITVTAKAEMGNTGFHIKKKQNVST